MTFFFLCVTLFSVQKFHSIPFAHQKIHVLKIGHFFPIMRKNYQKISKKKKRERVKYAINVRLFNHKFESYGY